MKFECNKEEILYTYNITISRSFFEPVVFKLDMLEILKK